MYEQYIEADLKRKRKKSALQLNTPEGLDYIRVARLHDIVRCSSISILLIFILFQLVVPLTKETISINNGGGGNWGGSEEHGDIGTIEQVSE